MTELWCPQNKQKLQEPSNAYEEKIQESRFGQIQIADLRFGYSIDSGTVCSDFFTQKYPPKFTQKFVITKKHTCNMPIHL